MRKWRLGRLRGGWAAVRYDETGRRHRHSLGTTDREAAERALAQLNIELLRPEQGATVAAIWKAYCEDLEGRAVVATMTHTAKAVLPRFGHLQPEAVTVELCREHIAARRKLGRSDGTIHTELGHLRMVLLWAVRRRLIPHAPHVERPPKPAPADRYLTREDAHRLLEAAAVPHLRLAIVLMIGTGARIEALTDLTWDRVDFERGLIYLADPADRARRKGRATVPMNRSVRAALLEAQAGALTGFVIEWAGKPVRSLKRGLATAAQKAGIDRVTHHLFRHSAAVWMAEAGRPMEEIAQFLGHSDINTTRRVYARFSPSYLREAAEVLNLETRAK